MKNIGFVLGSYHKELITRMCEVARQTAETEKCHVREEIWVPGSMEKPIAIKKLLLREDIDGVVVLGIIEKGETKHGLVMATAVIHSIINLQTELMKPIGVGILGPEIFPSQIASRIEPYARNAVLAVSAMLKIL